MITVMIFVICSAVIFVCGVKVGRSMQKAKQQKELMMNERKWVW